MSDPLLVQILDSQVTALMAGAGIAYVFGARQAKHQARQALFTRAISSVAVMRASRIYPAHLAAEHNLPEEEVAELERQVARENLLQYVRRATECREALAAVYPYAPEVKPYLSAVTVPDREIDQLIGLLSRRAARRLRLRL